MAPRTRRRKPENLVDVLDAAVPAMGWLTEADQPMIALARRYAAEIEAAAASESENQRTKMVGWLGPHLLSTLKAMGGTPEARKALSIDSQAKGRLAELRERRAG